MALHIAVFGSDLRLEGVTIPDKPSMIIGQPAGQPSLVISQLWYEKEGTASRPIVPSRAQGIEGARCPPRRSPRAIFFGGCVVRIIAMLWRLRPGPAAIGV